MEQPGNSNKNETMNNSLVNYKDEEKLMSESLYRNLHVLCRFSEPTAEFLLVVQPHMFIKSNARAFLVVMHFIFNCLDAAEFNKRFRWPLLDKTGETVFRKAAVDYMNHLNVTHQLGLETLKLSNIHIPGGLKFIKIIHKFTYLAMKLELSKPVHGSLPNVQNIPDGDGMVAKLALYVERGMDYASRLQVQSEIMRKRIDEMEAMMETFLGVAADTKKRKPCWACERKKWTDHLNGVVRDDVAPQLEVVNLLSKHTVQLNQLLTKWFVEKKENVVVYARDQLLAAQKCLKEIHPAFEQEIDGIVDGNFINFANLLKVFSLMIPNIMGQLEAVKGRHIEAIEYECNEIEQCDAITTKYYETFNEYKERIQPFTEIQIEQFQKFCQNTLKLPFNVMETPVVTRRPQLHRMSNRLGLIDDSTKKAQLFKESAVRRPSKLTSCSSLSTSYKSSNDAMQLLAKPKSRANSSMSSMPNMSILHRPFSTPKLSSTMSSTATNRPPSELKFSPSIPMTPTGVFARNFTETTSTLSPNGISVRKVTTSSVIHLNQPHIRSPTRRFYVNEMPSEFAAMMQANANLGGIISGPRMDHVDTVANGRHLEISSGNCEDINSVISKVGIENAAYISANLQTDELGVEFIGNISDSVLNDILSD